MRCKSKLFVLVIVLVGFMAGCASMGTGTAVRPMTATENAKLKYVEMEKRYAIQYADAVSLLQLIEDKKASLAQVRIYRIKRELLIKVWPLLKAYDEILLGGGVPGSERGDEINNLLNQLAAEVQ